MARKPANELSHIDASGKQPFVPQGDRALRVADPLVDLSLPASGFVLDAPVESSLSGQDSTALQLALIQADAQGQTTRSLRAALPDDRREEFQELLK